MANVNDVCDYIITKVCEENKGLSTLKLQKLLYYCQAWSLAFDRGPLFEGKFQAWVHGPVSRDVYNRFKDSKYLYSAVGISDVREGFTFESLKENERGIVDAVLNIYAGFSGDQLETMTHQEEPWISARGGIALHARCETELSEDVMKEFFKKRLEANKQ